MKVKSEREVAQSCPTLSDPMDCSPPGIFHARVLEWGAIAFSDLVAQSCATLCDPVVYSSPGSSVYRIFQARLEWAATPCSRGSSQTRDQTHISYTCCIGRQILYQLNYHGSPFCFWSLWIMLLQTFVLKSLCEHMLSFSLARYWKKELRVCRVWQPTPVLLPGKSLVGCSPWGR